MSSEDVCEFILDLDIEYGFVQDEFCVIYRFIFIPDCFVGYPAT